MPLLNLLVNFSLLVYLFQTVETNAYALIISEFGHRNEVLCTFATHCCATLSAMMLPWEETEGVVTDVALDDFFTDPVRSLSNFESFDPAQVSVMTNVSLGHWHTNEAYLLIFADRDTCSAGYLTIRWTALELRAIEANALLVDRSWYTDY